MADAYYTGSHPTTAADVKTAKFDARFPNTNQTKNCWQNYVDFHKCQKIKGDGHPVCKQFFQIYSSLCPVEWVNKWDEQRAEGVFATKEKI